MKYLTRSVLFSSDDQKERIYVVWEDGSVSITCSVCFKEDKLKDGEKWNGYLKNNPETRKDYRCFDCWKKLNDMGKTTKKDDYVDGARRGQAYNLAWQTLIAQRVYPDEKRFWTALHKLRDKIYEDTKE